MRALIDSSEMTPSAGFSVFGIHVLVIHSAVLAILDIGGVVFGYGVYRLVRPGDQILFQVPVAAAATCMAYLACALTVQKVSVHQPTIRFLILQTALDYVIVYLAAFLWTPAILVPVHFAVRGYITGFGNIAGAWIFQAIANPFALATCSILRHRVCRGSPVG